MTERLGATYVGDNTVLVRTIYVHKMFVDGRDVSLAPHLILDGTWESWITEHFLRLIRPYPTD